MFAIRHFLFAVFFLAFELHAAHLPVKKISVIGTGYVGLVLGAVLSEYGHEVICADIDQGKIEALNQIILPIYEPGLREIVEKNFLAGNLSFTSDLKKAVQLSDIIFICVGTPADENGKADLRAIESVAKTIGTYLNSYKLICTKSTVPIGTGKKIESIIRQHSHQPFDIASNPEFLREGSALYDCYNPDRTIIGVESEEAKQTFLEIYWPLVNAGIPFLFTKTIETAEAIKYASNAFLALKITFINEMSNLCDAIGANVTEVSAGMGLDKRIAPYFLNPGPGFGGSCFPKDVLALSECAKEHGVSMQLIDATLKANENQKKITCRKLLKLCDNSLESKVIALLGLSFKADTDDIRDSPAIHMIECILKQGGFIKAYDPIARQNMQNRYPNLNYCDSIEAAVANADAVVILTDANEFKSLELESLETLVHQKIILDTRNILNPHLLKTNGWKFSNFGRSN